MTAFPPPVLLSFFSACSFSSAKSLSCFATRPASRRCCFALFSFSANAALSVVTFFDKTSQSSPIFPKSHRIAEPTPESVAKTILSLSPRLKAAHPTTRNRSSWSESRPSAVAISVPDFAPTKSCLFANTATGLPCSLGSFKVSWNTETKQNKVSVSRTACMRDWTGYRGVTSGKVTQYCVNLPQYASKSYQYL